MWPVRNSLVRPAGPWTSFRTPLEYKGPSELAVGTNPCQTVGTIDTNLLVVFGVNHRWGDPGVNTPRLCGCGPSRCNRTAQPLQNQGIQI